MAFPGRTKKAPADRISAGAYIKTNFLSTELLHQLSNIFIYFLCAIISL